MSGEERPSFALECKVGAILGLLFVINSDMEKAATGKRRTTHLHHPPARPLQAWWAEKLLRGEKTVEVRQWPPPPHLFGESVKFACAAWLLPSPCPVPLTRAEMAAGKKVWLAATTGPDGQASLGDSVTAGQHGGELVRAERLMAGAQLRALYFSGRASSALPRDCIAAR